MKIEAEGDEKIAVTLTESDMQDFDITYEEMDYSNIETRRVIWTILDEAKRVLGRTINIDNRLLVQVSPGENGGCIIHFTESREKDLSTRKRLIMKKDAEPLLFRAFDADSFIDSMPLLKSLDQYADSTELFRLGDDYHAVIHPKTSCTDKILIHLCEFGEVTLSCRKDISRLYESGILLTSE